MVTPFSQKIMKIIMNIVLLQVYLHTAPLCHIGGISSCLAILMAGGCHVLIPKFDAKSAVKAIQEHKVTCFITVPAIMADLLSYAL
jgi:acyl-activating enzyme 14